MAKKTDIKFSKELFKNIGKLSPEVIYLLSKTGRLEYISPSFEEITGWKTEDWIGKHFRGIVHPRDLPTALKNFMISIAGKKHKHYLQLKKNKNGAYLLGEFHSIYIKQNGKVVGVMGLARNLTEQKKEEERKKSLIRASKLLSSSLEYEKTLDRAASLIVPSLADWCSIYLLDEKGKLKRLITKSSQNKFKKELDKLITRNISAEDEIQIGAAQVLKTQKPQLYRDLTPELVEKSTGKKELGKFVKKYRIKSAITVPVTSRKRVLGTMTFASSVSRYSNQDLDFALEIGKRAGQAIDNARLYKNAQEEIQARKQIAHELQQSRDQLKVIIDNIADGVTVQGSDGKLILVNKAAAKNSGYSSPEQMLENPNQWLKRYKLFDKDGKPYNLKNLPGRQALLQSKPNEDLMQFIDKKTKKEFWSLVKAMPVYSPKGKVKMVVNIIRDVTESKKMEKQKDIFISMASHELKTPLTSVRLYSQAIRSKLEKDKDYIPLFDSMNLQLNKLNNLIEDLLSVSRMKSGKLGINKKRFKFDKFINVLVNNMEKLNSSHNIKLVNTYDGFVTADKDKIEQVLVNFITNATKFSPKNSIITIRAKQRNGELIVSVQDKGIGIAKEHQQRVFERFYRAENDSSFSSGLGLGLFISKEIIDKHSGKIWLSSKPEEGSTFYFSLPLQK